MLPGSAARLAASSSTGGGIGGSPSSHLPVRLRFTLLAFLLPPLLRPPFLRLSFARRPLPLPAPREARARPLLVAASVSGTRRERMREVTRMRERRREEAMARLQPPSGPGRGGLCLYGTSPGWRHSRLAANFDKLHFLMHHFFFSTITPVVFTPILASVRPSSLLTCEV